MTKRQKDKQCNEQKTKERKTNNTMTKRQKDKQYNDQKEKK